MKEKRVAALSSCVCVGAYFISQLQSKQLADAKAAGACNFQLTTECKTSQQSQQVRQATCP